jgi:hypothetical protein
MKAPKAAWIQNDMKVGVENWLAEKLPDGKVKLCGW